jgi:hypothetical protein
MSKQRRSEERKFFGFLGHIFYLIAISLCVYMLGLAYTTWAYNPEKLLHALIGFLFFGGGMLVIVFLWFGDFTAHHLLSATRHHVLAICGFMIAAASLATFFLGNIVFGALGAILFSLCALAAMRSAKNK